MTKLTEMDPVMDLVLKVGNFTGYKCITMIINN